MGYKTLASMTIYLYYDEKEAVEEEARQQNLSVSNLLRNKLSLPELKRGRKKSVRFDHENASIDTTQTADYEEPVIPPSPSEETIQLSLFHKSGDDS